MSERTEAPLFARCSPLVLADSADSASIPPSYCSGVRSAQLHKVPPVQPHPTAWAKVSATAQGTFCCGVDWCGGCVATSFSCYHGWTPRNARFAAGAAQQRHDKLGIPTAWHESLLFNLCTSTAWRVSVATTLRYCVTRVRYDDFGAARV